jgi:uncharacterized protein YjbI with pentapeptide repeats
MGAEAVIRALFIAICAAASVAHAADVVNCAIRPGTLCVEANLEAAQLAGADLALADFSRSNLRGADLRGANLRNADLDATRLERADLSDAVLEEADLTGADLRDANLRRARLANANLSGADLRGAHLDEADLRGADLRGALFDAAQLRNADTDGCLGCPAAVSRAAELIGASVVNRRGERLAELKELILDLRTGRVHAAVLELGGMLGVGETQYAVHARRLAVQGDKLVLDADRETLRSAADLEESRWPPMDASPSSGLMRATELIGREVRDPRDQEAGEVKDVVVSLVDGRIRHYFVEHDGRQARIKPDAVSLTHRGELELKKSLIELARRRSAALEK